MNRGQMVAGARYAVRGAPGVGIGIGIGIGIGLLTVLPSRVLAQEHEHVSPYAGTHEAREVKALSPEEIRALLEGEGMGYALAAELNGVPGPLHALDLADSLALTAAQTRDVQRVFDAMRAQARRLGAELVAEERALDLLFSSGAADPASVRAHTTRSAALEGELRAVHLTAHLATRELLTATQVHAYLRLRGYGGH